MDRIKNVSFINYIMLFLNWVIVLTVCFFVLKTTMVICDHYSARSFLDVIQAVPWTPKRIAINALSVLVLLTVSFVLREFLYQDNTRVEVGTLLFDFVASLYLIMILSFNYNGVLLWVFANVISHTKKSTGQIMFMLLGIASFVLTGYGFISITYRLFDIQDYINYYNPSLKPYLVGGFNALTSLNMAVFIIFCILVILKQRGTIQEVNQLYHQLSKANENLRDANHQLEEYADMKEKMGETRERNRLAREIHDTLGHTLTGISAGIDACLATIDVSRDITKRQLEIISDAAREGIQEVRQSVSELKPDALERLSLEYAIRKLVNDTNAITTTTKVAFDCKIKNLRFDEDEENAIYRVIQESVTNAIRHGSASKIQITMEKEDGEIHLMIKDNGCGCEKITPGFGTTHIKERIQMLGGDVSFDGSNGFLVMATIPIRWGEEYD